MRHAIESMSPEAMSLSFVGDVGRALLLRHRS